MKFDSSGAIATMPPKKDDKKARVGRPKTDKPLHSIVSLKGTDELEAWLDGLTETSDSGTRAQTLRRALKAFAAEQGYEPPMPKK